MRKTPDRWITPSSSPAMVPPQDPVDLLCTLTGRGRLLAGVLLAGLFTLPGWANGSWLSVMTAALWFAYAGQAWNVLMGLAGQLSIGHGLYVGLAATISVGLAAQTGLGPWFGVGPAMVGAALVGAGLGALGFRFGARGLYFPILTLLGAELARALLAPLPWVSGVGASAPALSAPGASSPELPILFYYGILILTLLALVLVRWLRECRLGHHWLAVREDPEAAAAVGIDVFRARLSALMVSAAMTAPAGVFLAYYKSPLFSLPPLSLDPLFSFSQSVDILLVTLFGGLGTLFGPVLGALVLTPLGEGLAWLAHHAGHPLPGFHAFCSGVELVLVLVLLPGGLWPWLARRLDLVTFPEAPGPKRPDAKRRERS